MKHGPIFTFFRETPWGAHELPDVLESQLELFARGSALGLLADVVCVVLRLMVVLEPDGRTVRIERRKLRRPDSEPCVVLPVCDVQPAVGNAFSVEGLQRDDCVLAERERFVNLGVDQILRELHVIPR
jgi:hypothetical protein